LLSNCRGSTDTNAGGAGAAGATANTNSISAGMMNNVIPHLLELTIKKSKKLEVEVSKVAFIKLMSIFLLYNPQLALGFLEKLGATNSVFSMWFSYLNIKLVGSSTIKLSILGLSSLFLVPFSDWPKPLTEQLKVIFLAVVELQTKYNDIQHQKRKRDEKEKQQGVNDNTIPFYSKSIIIKLGDDDNDNDDNNNIATDSASSVIEALISKYDEDDYDDNENDNEDEDWSYTISDIDTLLIFFDNLQRFSTRSPSAYHQLTSSLQQHETAKLNNLLVKLKQQKQQ